MRRWIAAFEPRAGGARFREANSKLRGPEATEGLAPGKSWSEVQKLFFDSMPDPVEILSVDQAAEKGCRGCVVFSICSPFLR